jgi:hypothetical protein
MRRVYCLVVRHWQFIEHALPSGRWTWRLVKLDNTIEKTSAEFRSYGDVVGDAIRHGFRPSEDDWVVESLHTVARFSRQRSPVVTRKTFSDHDDGPERKAS